MLCIIHYCIEQRQGVSQGWLIQTNLPDKLPNPVARSAAAASAVKWIGPSNAVFRRLLEAADAAALAPGGRLTGRNNNFVTFPFVKIRLLWALCAVAGFAVLWALCFLRGSVTK